MRDISLLATATNERILLPPTKFTRWPDGNLIRSRGGARDGAAAVHHAPADVRRRGGVDAELARAVHVLLLDVPPLHLQQPDDAAAGVVPEGPPRPREPVDEVQVRLQVVPAGGPRVRAEARRVLAVDPELRADVLVLLLLVRQPRRHSGHLGDRIARVHDAQEVDLAASVEPVHERGVAHLGPAEGEHGDGRHRGRWPWY